MYLVKAMTLQLGTVHCLYSQCTSNVLQHAASHLFKTHSVLLLISFLVVLFRAENKAVSSENSLSAVQKRLDDLAAENRVLMEGSTVMRQECNQAWVCNLNWRQTVQWQEVGHHVQHQ